MDRKLTPTYAVGVTVQPFLAWPDHLTHPSLAGLLFIPASVYLNTALLSSP